MVSKLSTPVQTVNLSRKWPFLLESSDFLSVTIATMDSGMRFLLYSPFLAVLIRKTPDVINVSASPLVRLNPCKDVGPFKTNPGRVVWNTRPFWDYSDIYIYLFFRVYKLHL